MYAEFGRDNAAPGEFIVMHMLIFIAGLMMGSCLGLLVASLCRMAK